MSDISFSHHGSHVVVVEDRRYSLTGRMVKKTFSRGILWWKKYYYELQHELEILEIGYDSYPAHLPDYQRTKTPYRKKTWKFYTVDQLSGIDLDLAQEAYEKEVFGK